MDRLVGLQRLLVHGMRVLRRIWPLLLRMLLLRLMLLW